MGGGVPAACISEVRDTERANELHGLLRILAVFFLCLVSLGGYLHVALPGVLVVGVFMSAGFLFLFCYAFLWAFGFWNSAEEFHWLLRLFALTTLPLLWFCWNGPIQVPGVVWSLFLAQLLLLFAYPVLWCMAFWDLLGTARFRRSPSPEQLI